MNSFNIGQNCNHYKLALNSTQKSLLVRYFASAREGSTVLCSRRTRNKSRDCIYYCVIGSSCSRDNKACFLVALRCVRCDFPATNECVETLVSFFFLAKKMPKRTCPFPETFSSQYKIHIGQQELNNYGVFGSKYRQEIYGMLTFLLACKALLFNISKC